MRNNLPVTQKEQTVQRDANILSTTNAKGQITHINEEFINISGFSRDELIGSRTTSSGIQTCPELRLTRCGGD